MEGSQQALVSPKHSYVGLGARPTAVGELRTGRGFGSVSSAPMVATLHGGAVR